MRKRSTIFSGLSTIAGASTLFCGAALAVDFAPLEHFQAPGSAPLQLKAYARTRDVVIGGYPVAANDTLTFCTMGGRCSNPYAGAAILLNPQQHLTFTLRNMLAGGAPPPDHCMYMGSGDRTLLNLHMHGLLVAPSRVKVGGKIVYGDYIFDCTSAGGSNGAVVGDRMRFDIGAPPGVSHPRGDNWIHPHVHGLAKQQVSSGMASMIIIGAINKQLCAKPSPGGAPQPSTCAQIPASAVRHLILKDAQLTRAGTSGPWTNMTDQNPDFCGPNKNNPITQNRGECDAGAGVAPSGGEGKWVFTINGEKTPHTEIAPNQYQVWRIQNASANVTYSLSLQKAAAPKAPFQILDMDGAGLAPSGVAGPAQLPSATDIILMPGSRADLLVQAPTVNASDETYTLVNSAFQAGFADTDADTWPQIALADVTFKASTTQVAAYEPMQSVMHAYMRYSPPPINAVKVKQDLPNQCLSLDGGVLAPGDVDAYYANLTLTAPRKRRVYFGVDGNNFVLGDTIIDDSGGEWDKLGRPIDAANPVRLSTFAMHGMATQMCVPLGANENWQLVNVSNEVHNFHIHQIKFAVARDGAGAPIMRTQADSAGVDRDKVILPNQLLFKNGPADLMHDTIVVPRGQSACASSMKPPAAGASYYTLDRANPANKCRGDGSADDISGMIEVNLKFAGEHLSAFADGTGKKRQPKFVYHCHILEHEDKGMMAGVTVLDLRSY
ncbi:MAG: multicopper oxidase domain-containing protein [Hyphomicrobiales bacterium]|nr:multicopper oxidase domain-containing protein [Hyphomicrobiales bacterium]